MKQTKIPKVSGIEVAHAKPYCEQDTLNNDEYGYGEYIYAKPLWKILDKLKIIRFFQW